MQRDDCCRQYYHVIIVLEIILSICLVNTPSIYHATFEMPRHSERMSDGHGDSNNDRLLMNFRKYRRHDPNLYK